MKTYRYEESEQAVRDITGLSIFLAGPTVRGHQPHLTSWRFEAIEEFKRQGFDGSLIIPEFTSKTESDKSKDWVPIWEFNGLKKADVILFWLPRTKELIGLTTNYELGMWVARNPSKVIYGRPDDAYRISYCDIMWKEQMEEIQSDRPIYNTLPETINAAIHLAIRKNISL